MGEKDTMTGYETTIKSVINQLKSVSEDIGKTTDPVMLLGAGSGFVD